MDNKLNTGSELMKGYAFYYYNREYLYSFGFGVTLFIFSLLFNYFAGIYATEVAGSSVPDIILSNTKPIDVRLIFVYGPIVLWAFVVAICLRHPQRMPFVIKNIAVFTIIRSFFISLTHIGPFPTQIAYNSDILQMFMFGGDLFFSGHTGLPFLLALIFWKDLKLRILFFVSAVIFGVVVLMGHLHYTIDVLSAFFITYTIFHIAKALFPKDYVLFYEGIRQEKK